MLVSATATTKSANPAETCEEMISWVGVALTPTAARSPVASR
ncbi:hypothetical protein [Streptomyces sp. NPDC095613]